MSKNIISKRIKNIGNITKEDLLKFVVLPNIKLNSNGCWIWQRTLNNKGYAQTYICNQNFLVHRLILTFKNFKEPDQTDHSCLNKACVNENHLEDVNGSVNTQRMWQSRNIMHCKRGHIFSEENTILRRNGTRGCKICAKRYNCKRYNLEQAIKIVNRSQDGTTKGA